VVALRALIWLAFFFLVLLAFAGCEVRVETLPPPPSQAAGVWKEKAMVNGPTLYWTCVGGDKIYAMQELAERARTGLWPGASIAVAAGGCL
jgi:hypothetical protein